jgi:hypothetical protein
MGADVNPLTRLPRENTIGGRVYRERLCMCERLHHTRQCKDDDMRRKPRLPALRNIKTMSTITENFKTTVDCLQWPAPITKTSHDNIVIYRPPIDNNNI